MKKRVFLLIVVFLFLSVQIITSSKAPQINTYQDILKSQSTETNAVEIMVMVNLTCIAPSGHDLPGNTPIVVNLSTIAKVIPETVDAFGMKTTDKADDIKWDSAYVTYNNDLIPAQVDDIDIYKGYSDGDELVFELPEDIALTNENNITFSIFFGTKGLDLPPPYFPETCDVYIYPKIDEINERYPDMLGPKDGAYYMENGIIQACALVEAAWSSGGLYELSVLDDQGESQWDAIKQRYKVSFDMWKWSRFALIEQFISKNQFATTFPFKLEHFISGPVRAQFQMQSKSDYGKSGTPWGNIPNVYGLVTYDLYANQPYLDYTLEIVGPDANKHPSLVIQYQNREWGGKPGSPYKSIYVPGQGWLERNPNDILTHKVLEAGFNQSWYLEGLYGNQKILPSSFAGPDDDQLGYGFIFDDTGFANITWDAGSEAVLSWYDACEFPFRTRYCPYDVSILAGQDRISYVKDQYQAWLRPDPEFSLTASLVTPAEIPFDYIFITKPDIIFDNVTDLLQIVNISAYSTVLTDFLTGTTPDVSATYKVLTERKQIETGISGSLTWKDSSETWEALDVDVSSINLNESHVVVAYFTVNDISGRSAISEHFIEGILPDLTGPIISDVTRSPADVVRFTDSVNVTASVEDEEGEVTLVYLFYSNGSTWYNLTMNQSFGFYRGTIPPQKSATTVKFKIGAYDDAPLANYNESEIFEYFVSIEYIQGQGLLPLIGISGIIVVAIVIALKSGALHREKYDQVE
ncbi:MAG: hypothetical protein ACFFB5_04915 [Promethearchaeota archaeon]